MMRVVKQWYKLLREVADAQSIEAFQFRLDVLSNLIYVKMFLHISV